MSVTELGLLPYELLLLLTRIPLVIAQWRASTVQLYWLDHVPSQGTLETPIRAEAVRLPGWLGAPSWGSSRWS